MNFDPSTLAQNAAPLPRVAGGAFNLAAAGPKIVMERKMDGFRLLMHRSENGVEFFTRTGKSQKGKLPQLEAELMALPVGTWLDGEIISLDDDGFAVWGEVQSVLGANIQKAASRSSNLMYMAFDILAYDGLDIRSLPFSERRGALEQVITSSARLRVTPQVEATLEAHDELVAEGWEGSIVKSLDAPYASGKRGRGWWKLKPTDEMDCIIMGFKPGQDGFTGMIGAIEFGQIKDGVLTHRGRCSGMDMKTRKLMSADEAGHIGQVISLKYMGIMPSGSPRHPQFSRIRLDKPAIDCEWT